MSQNISDLATELLNAPLSVEQRLDLISCLWESIPDSAEASPVPDWHREEVERRLEEADANPGAAIPWDQVRKRLLEKP